MVLPILSYLWGLDAKHGAAAQALHKGFLLGVRKSTATHMVLAELRRFPLQIYFWQRISRHHYRETALDDIRLVKLEWLVALL